MSATVGTNLGEGPRRLPRRIATLTRGRREAATGLLFVLPSLLLLATFAIYPLLSSLWLSLHRRHIFARAGEFVGIDNFIVLLADPTFWSALGNGLIFSLSTVVLQLVLGVATALLLSQAFRGRGLVRGIVLFPFVVPTVVAVLVWKWMLNDLYGVVNLLLIETGLVRESVLWLASPSLAMATVVGINVWMFFPFITIHVLARMQLIPGTLYEAARIDGAGPLQRFWYVTLPQLRSTILIVVLIRGIWMFNKFDAVWLITEGGPLGTTQTLPLLAYLRAFGQYQLGSGAAVATLIFLILAVGGAFYLRLLREDRET
ncbi:MAG: sugar ABC transporter permease [Alphaproteobacteria bacterium]|nr:sugar ABC transporter permease [Alphaproteobacteria bacterium]